MKPTWILEAGVFGDAIRPLQAELQRQGLDHHLVPYTAFTRGGYELRDLAPTGETCVVFYGSHPMMHYLRKYHPAWVPGGWCNFANLACSTYYAYFGRYLLNSEYVMMPGVEAVRQRDFLYATFGDEGELFVRPDSVEKIFTGRCVGYDEFSAALAPTRYNPATLVVIAKPQEISREWRLVIANDDVVAASQYYLDGVPASSEDCPEEVKQYARKLLAEVSWRPDPVFLMDICEAKGDLFLLELNSFSCSGLYACDLSAVVREVTAVALQEWDRRSEAGTRSAG